VNQWLKLRNREAGSNLVDMGRWAVREVPTGLLVGVSTPKPCSSDGGEVMVKGCGVAMAMLPE
jgi:hypothetical protein